MEAVKSYILSITAAALLCAIVYAFQGKSGANAKLMKLMSGLFMLLVIFSPLIKKSVQIPDMAVENVFDEAEILVANAEYNVRTKIDGIIKEKTEAYILEKANDLNADICVSVTLRQDEQYSIPDSVQITGNIAPYAKKLLSQVMHDELGIALEDQIWN